MILSTGKGQLKDKSGLKFIKDTFITFSTQILGIILGIISTIAIARVLGPSNQGVYSLSVLINSLISMIGNSGIGVANIYFGRSKRYEIADLAANSIISSFILGIPLIMIFLLYYILVHPSFLAGVDSMYIIIASILVPIALLQAYFIHLLLGQNRIMAYNLNSLIQNLTFSFLLLLALLVFKAGLLGAILSWAISLLAGSVTALIQVNKTTPLIWKFDKIIFREAIKYGIKGHLGNLMQVLNYRLNMFIIALYMTTAAVGYFSISTSMAEMLLLLPGAIGTVILVRTPSLTAKEANISTPLICRTTLFITAILAIIFFVIAKPMIVIFFGTAYLPAVSPLYILLPGIVLATCYRVLSNEMMGRGKPIVNTIIAGISLIATISLNILLVPKMGINGAALASTLAYAIGSLVTILLFVNISGINFIDVIIVKKDDFKLYLKSIREILKKNTSGS
jgi:O-antigen/teichoic acid export membrane protein